MASSSGGEALLPPSPAASPLPNDDEGTCPQCGVEYDDSSYWDVETLADCRHFKCHRCVKKWWLDCVECEEEHDNEYIANYPPNWPWHKPTWGDLKGTEEQCKFCQIIIFRSGLPVLSFYYKVIGCIWL